MDPTMTHVLSAAPSPAPPRHPGLDLLRALAIAMVVGYHSSLFGFTLPGGVHRFGWIGVDLFFVLSGYLTHKLVVHAAAGWLKSHGIALNSVGAILTAYALTLLVGTALYLAVERPFLQLRNRIES